MSRWLASAASCCAFLLNVARGRWRDNPHVEIHEGEKVVLKLLSRTGKRKCVIDGELMPLARETTVEIHKKVLNVLVPAEPQSRQDGLNHEHDPESGSRFSEDHAANKGLSGG